MKAQRGAVSRPSRSVNLWMAGVALWAAAVLMGAGGPSRGGPRYNVRGELQFPSDYRGWVFLSSGLGMTYRPPAKAAANPNFDNVFVSRAAYRSFLQTGLWPDRTVLILEVRASQSKGSINRGGHFQGELLGVEAEVKDAGRFPGKWAFFDMGKGAAGKRLPAGADCYTCHAAHGAVDNTFVQFYPELLAVAKRKGTLKASQ